jgi:hypothetical protein
MKMVIESKEPFFGIPCVRAGRSASASGTSTKEKSDTTSEESSEGAVAFARVAVATTRKSGCYFIRIELLRWEKCCSVGPGAVLEALESDCKTHPLLMLRVSMLTENMARR